MERQAVTTDKDSGIVNDANRWATETMGNAKYPLELFLRVITCCAGARPLSPPLNMSEQSASFVVNRIHETDSLTWENPSLVRAYSYLNMLLLERVAGSSPARSPNYAHL